jgi:hypothetical protein
MTRTNKLRRWTIAATMAVTMMASSVAEAAGTLRTVPSQLDKSDASKYGEGKRAYDKGDYASAAKTFAGIMGRVPESPINRTIRASLVLDVMAAYQAAYEGSGDIAMLKAGVDAYYAYFQAYRDAHASTNIPESVVEARFVLKEALGHAEAKKNGGKPDDGGKPSDGGKPNDGVTAASGSTAASTDDPGKPGTTLIASGAVLIALGVGATAMIGIGAIEGKRAREDGKLPGYTDEQRDTIDKRGRSMNSLLIAGAVTAPVLAIAGISLVVVGAKSKRKAQLALAPSVTRRFAGVVLRGRF